MTTFTHDLLHALIAAGIALVIALVALVCLVVAGVIVYHVADWLANVIAGADALGRAGLAVGALALVALVVVEKERAR